MQARDDGLLDLDDPISAHLDVPAHGDATIRRLLSHTAGFQREPYGDVWDTLVAPDAAGLLAELDRAERVLPNARRFHYSNLAVAVLGQLVARLRGGTWATVLRERILEPLGLAATTVEPPAEAVVGYLVDAYSDAARPEPQLDLGGVGPAAQLWSTAADMARWAAFLAAPEIVDPGGAVLAPDHPRRDALAADHHRRDALGGRLRPRPDPGAAGPAGWCTSGTTAPCPVSWPASTAGAAARATRARWAARCWAPPAPPGRSTSWSHELLAAGRRDRTRPTSGRGRRAAAAPADVPVGARARGGARASQFVFSWHDGALQARVAGRARPTGRRRSSGRCPTSRTCCGRSPGGRRASCCG